MWEKILIYASFFLMKLLDYSVSMNNSINLYRLEIFTNIYFLKIYCDMTFIYI